MNFVGLEVVDEEEVGVARPMDLRCAPGVVGVEEEEVRELHEFRVCLY